MFGGSWWRSDTGGNGHAAADERPEPGKVPGRIGVALGGGAARGWAHIGVLRALDEVGIEARHHRRHLDRRGRRRLLSRRHPRRARRLRTRPHAAARLRPPRPQLRRQRPDQRQAADQAARGPAQRDADRGSAAAAASASPPSSRTGHEIWISHGNLIEAMRASYALPGVFQPVRVNGRWLVDGALVNPVPVSVCRALGADVVIAVNLNADDLRPRHRHPGPLGRPDRRAGDRSGRRRGRRQRQAGPPPSVDRRR